MTKEERKQLKKVSKLLLSIENNSKEWQNWEVYKKVDKAWNIVAEMLEGRL